MLLFYEFNINPIKKDLYKSFVHINLFVHIKKDLYEQKC